MTIPAPCTSIVGRRERIRLRVRGIVQGIGFRPSVYRLAKEVSLSGWVANTREGAMIELEGTSVEIKKFQKSFLSSLPTTARIEDIQSTPISVKEEQTFSILSSEPSGQSQPVLSPDLSTCDDCLQEIQDPLARRYRYPFTTCAACGPRYSLALALPYDRSSTCMQAFPPCPQCQREYEDINDRRFHAETIACPLCGPQVELWDKTGKILSTKNAAMEGTIDLLQGNCIVAVKGIGGFQLWANALNSSAIADLRRRKQRPSKSFAVLFSSLGQLRQYCDVTPKEERLLRTSAAPIVLVRKKGNFFLANNVAPNNPYLGAMLPHSPLHHLLTASLNFPLVATSGNRKDEPLVYEEKEVLERLGMIADAFLVHDRRIARPVDDSVARIVNDRSLILRRARGYVPTPLPRSCQEPSTTPGKAMLAVGGHLKNTVSLATPTHIIPSQHIGDLSSAESYTRFQHIVADLLTLFQHAPEGVVCDSHPDYRSTHFANDFARQRRLPIIPVQHHHAHLATCMAEHNLTEPVLGVIWDGAGYGLDGTTWGGEFLQGTKSGFARVGYLRPFALPGGERCMKDPWRVALSLLHETCGKQLRDLDFPFLHSLGHESVHILQTMIDRRFQSPLTSSVGRLFEGVSALLNLCQTNSFEGEAAMALEFLADQCTLTSSLGPYPLPAERPPEKEGEWIADWRPLISHILQDISNRINPAIIAWRFHRTLVQWILNMTQASACSNVVLAGGVFQNALLLSLAEQTLTEHHLNVFIPQQYGLNDGGLSVGQSFVGLQSCV